MLFLFLWTRPTLWNSIASFLENSAWPCCLFLLSGLKKLWCLYLVILDGVIVQSKILLHPSPTLDTRVLSLRPWSKLVGVIFNKPLSVCWVDDIRNIISSASDMELSCHVVGKSTWSEKLSSEDSKHGWSFACISGLKSTRTPGLSIIKIEKFGDTCSPKTLFTNTMPTFITCLQTFPFNSQSNHRKK